MSLPCARICDHYSDVDVYYTDGRYEPLCSHHANEMRDVVQFVPQHGSDNVCLPMTPGVLTQPAIGERIAHLRLLVGLSRASFAQQCGLDRSTIFRIERGQRMPTPETLKLIADELDTTIEQILSP